MFAMNTWMNQAIELAKQAALQDEVPVGAILVHGGKVIGSGFNRREQKQLACAHAEIEALTDFSSQQKTWRLPSDTYLYVTAEPCLMCTGALLWARLDHLVYGCSDPKNAGLGVVIKEIESGRFDHRFASVTDNVLETQCAGLLKAFFKKKRVQ